MMDALTLAIPPFSIIFRTAVIYLIILVGLRLAGKREIGQMTIFDLVMLLLIANAVQNAMVGPDTSLIGGILAAAVLLILNYGIARLRLYSPLVRRLVEGTPTLLVLHGETITRNLHREGLDQDILETALREHGISEISDVEMAVLEVDGSISVVPSGTNHKRVKNPTKFLRSK
jgi:uncharacterized membrane protein YcaP (DUF421 family)